MALALGVASGNSGERCSNASLASAAQPLWQTYGYCCHVMTSLWDPWCLAGPGGLVGHQAGALRWLQLFNLLVLLHIACFFPCCFLLVLRLLVRLVIH